MWSLGAWHRSRILDQHPVDQQVWDRVRQRLAILDGLNAEEDQRLRERSVLFLQDKHLTALPGVELDD